MAPTRLRWRRVVTVSLCLAAAGVAAQDMTQQANERMGTTGIVAGHSSSAASRAS